MGTLEIPRRKFLTGLVGLIAAPAVVKASSLMPVKNPYLPVEYEMALADFEVSGRVYFYCNGHISWTSLAEGVYERRWAATKEIDIKALFREARLAT